MPSPKPARLWRAALHFGLLALLAAAVPTQAQSPLPVVADIPTRPGVTQRVRITPPSEGAPKAILVLFTGGNGALFVTDSGELTTGRGNFLMRSRAHFARAGYLVVAIDTPSDRREAPYLSGFRQTDQHLADVTATLVWLREKAPGLPIWLVGTSRGTQSVAYVASRLPRARGGPDGIVLTASIFVDQSSRTVQQMPLERADMPALIVHHRRDECRACPFGHAEPTLAKFTAAPRKGLIAIEGGVSQGDPCEAFAHHGFNGVEAETVAKIVAWIDG